MSSGLLLVYVANYTYYLNVNTNNGMDFFCFVSAQFRISCFFSVSFLVRLLYRAAVGVYISTSLLKSSDFVHDKKIAISQSCFHFFHLITYLKFWICNFNATWFFAKNEFPSLCRHGINPLWVFVYTYMKFEVFCWNFSSSTNLQILRRDILKVEENDNCLVK